MKLKRILAFCLTLTLLVGLLPLGTAAEELDDSPVAVAEESDPASCVVCGEVHEGACPAEESKEETDALNESSEDIAPPAPQTTPCEKCNTVHTGECAEPQPTICELCGKEPHEGDCIPCEKCGTVHTDECAEPQPTVCELCGKEPHEGDCVPCEKCGTVHTGECAEPQPTVCELCGKEPHEGDCIPCEKCNTVHTGECAEPQPTVCELCGKEIHEGDCVPCEKCGTIHTGECGVESVELECTCEEGAAVHGPNCPLYAPAPVMQLYYKEDMNVQTVPHSAEQPLDMNTWKDKTLYVVNSSEYQELYFHYSGFAEFGAHFSVTESELWTLNTQPDPLVGLANTAALTLTPEIPDGTEINVVAKRALNLGSVSVTIVVVNEAPKAGVEGQFVELDGMEFSLPAMGAVAPISEEKQMALYEALNPSKGAATSQNAPQFHFYDIESEEGGEITISGLLEDDADKHVIVYHLLKDASKIANYMFYMELSGDEFAAENAAAKEFSGEDGRVYYDVQLATLDSNGDITFATDSYSSFIFQVGFEYNGYHMSLDGGSQESVEKLLEGLGIDRSQNEIVSIEFTDSSLMVAEKENSEWIVRSLRGFDTQEAMYITFSDGEVIEVVVTDPAFYYYLTDTDGVWNMDTENATIQGKEYVTNTTCVLPLTYQNNTQPANYTPEIDVFVHPGMALKVTRWISGFTAASATADGWTFYWNEKDVAASTDAEKDARWFNYMLINPGITEYKKITLNLLSHYKIDNVHQPITLRVHVIPKKSTPTLLRDTLEANPQLGLEIKEYPMTLYNFDATDFNNYVNTLGGRYNFRGYSKGIYHAMIYPNFAPNKGGNGALMGIMNDNLNADGWPTMKYDPNVDVFSEQEFPGKEVYHNVPFEFVFDPETQRYFYSSTLNHAQLTKDSAGNDKVVLYRESLGASQLAAPYSDNESGANTRGGFYPFEDINRAFVNPTPDKERVNENQKDTFDPYMDKPATDTDLQAWKEALKNGDLNQRAELVLDLPTSNNSESTIDMQYGYSIDAYFYLPEDRMLEGEPMEFAFTGDDDLWVFIDGKLVLDIGGPHTPVEGVINLKTGYVSVNKYQVIEGSDRDNLKIVDDAKYKGQGYLDDHIVNLANDEMHHLQVFYLERVGGVANCYLTFNLPIIPANSVTMTCDVLDEDGHDLSVELMQPHTYQIQVAKHSNEESAYKPMPNELYYLNGDTNEPRYTNENGEFQLMHGQSAVFPNIPRYYEGAHDGDEPNHVRFVQYLNDGTMYYRIHSSGTYGEQEYTLPQNEGKKAVTTVAEDVPAEGNIVITMKNYLYADPMEITCQVTGGKDGLVNPEQEFTYMLSFKPEVLFHPDLNDPDYGIDNPEVDEETGTDHHWMTFTLKHGETLRLESVPRGQYFRLRAVDPDQRTVTSFDPPIATYTYTNTASGTENKASKMLNFIGVGGTHDENESLFLEAVLQKGDHNIIIQNTQRGSLMIQQKGTDETNDPHQTHIYNVKGTNDHNKDVDMDVVVYGNEMATIRGVIIGDYTVTQKDAWSWRYSNTQSPQSVENTQFFKRPSGYGYLFTFTDSREKPYWLDGNSWCRNILDGITVRSDKQSGN